MAKFANQRTIIIHKEKVLKDTERLYLCCYNDNLYKALQELDGSDFKVFIYLCSQKNNFKFDYSPTYLSKKLNLSTNTLKAAFHRLEERGYLVAINDNKTIYNFYENVNTPQSQGECKILNLLEKHNFNFIYDKPFFEDLLGDYLPLRYDFILLTDENKPWRIIEFDGPQHESNTINNEEAFQKIQRYDKIKNEYALSHNIPLIRIPYIEKDNITIDLLLGDKYLIKGDINGKKA